MPLVFCDGLTALVELFAGGCSEGDAGTMDDGAFVGRASGFGAAGMPEDGSRGVVGEVGAGTPGDGSRGLPGVGVTPVSRALPLDLPGSALPELFVCAIVQSEALQSTDNTANWILILLVGVKFRVV